MNVTDPQTHSWHIDRRIPAAIILTLAGQTVAIVLGLVIWGAKMDSRVAMLEATARERAPIYAQFSAMKALFDRQERDAKERFSRLETKLDGLLLRIGKVVPTDGDAPL